MKVNENNKTWNRSFISALLFILLLMGIDTVAQSLVGRKSIPAPSSEEFKPDNALVTDSVGYGKRTIYDISEQETLRIFDADGLLWYELSFFAESPLYFRKNENVNFKPYHFLKIERSDVLLRTKAVSKNWYEVVINEETQETKYVLKNDPIVDYVKFEKFILSSVKITFDKEKNPLRDADGDRIKSVEVSDGDVFFPVFIDGDLLQVKRQVSQGLVRGWVKWRTGRNILIGFSLNDYVAPKQ